MFGVLAGNNKLDPSFCIEPGNKAFEVSWVFLLRVLEGVKG